MSDQVRQFTVDADDNGIRVDRWFKRHLPQIGFATVNRWARTGQIRVDGGRVKPEDRLATGQKLRVPPGGDTGTPTPRRHRDLTDEQLAYAEAMLLERTDSAFILNKPPGLATQGGTGTTQHVDGLLDAYANDDEQRPRLVHRLDKDTSGVLLIARTAGSAAFFSKSFASRTAKKIYWALVVGVPDVAEGVIDAPLAKQPGSGGEKMHVDKENGQTAKTRYRVIERAGNSTAWVELQPFTGRTHQLRVHMAAIGHPIVGDGKYGGQAAFLTGTISRKLHLHARRLVIDAPKGQQIDVTANLPEHFAASMEQLGFDLTNSKAAPIEPPPPPNKADKKRDAKAFAKQYRKERRGERRSRGSAEPTRRDEKQRFTGAVRPAGKGATKAHAEAVERSGAKPFARTARKPDGKPGAKEGYTGTNGGRGSVAPGGNSAPRSGAGRSGAGRSGAPRSGAPRGGAGSGGAGRGGAGRGGPAGGAPRGNGPRGGSRSR